MFRFADVLFDSADSYVKTIDDFILPTINNLIASNQSELASWQAKIESAKSNEQTLISAIQSSQKKIESRFAKLHNSKPRKNFEV